MTTSRCLNIFHQKKKNVISMTFSQQIISSMLLQVVIGGQKGPKNLPQDGPKCVDNGFYTQDSMEGKSDHWILRGRRETPLPSTR